MRSTTTLVSRSQSRGECCSGWALCLALDCDHLAAKPVRVSLADLTEVELGRASTRGFARSEARLRVDLPNRAASQVHARLSLDGDAWLLEDAGSKNGTQVNDRRVKRAVLGDGDVIGCGGSFLVIRRVSGAMRDLEEADPRLGALRTLSPGLQRELAIVPKLARSKLPILVRGESGTGKEVAARAIHGLSDRRGALITVNCGAIPATLIESELFGSRRGAFSGAEDRLGLVRSAEHGTLFLDEVAELPLPSQVALLRLLQDGEVMPLGAGKASTVDVRIVAATHQRLESLVASGEFRRDLYARLRGHELHLLPLVQRLEDLGLLIAALLARIEPAGPERRLTPAAARALFAHRWPFHVRELEQTLRGAVAVADGPAIDVADLRLSTVVLESSPANGGQRGMLVSALTRHAGNLSAVARELTTSRTQIQRLLHRYELRTDAFKRG
jgi:transcriptional regulator with PAS, ATPase and Fis domain